MKRMSQAEKPLAYYTHTASLFLIRYVCLEIHVGLGLAPQLFRAINMHRACVV